MGKLDDATKEQILDCIRHHESEYLSFLVEENDNYFYIDNGKKMGWCCIKHCEDFDANIEWLEVFKNYRGSGIGKKMVIQIIEVLKVAGCHQIHLISRDQNVEKFWRRMGFIPDWAGECSNYHMDLYERKMSNN